MKYDFIIFTPFGKSRFIGGYKIAKVLRDAGYAVKVIDFLFNFVNDSDSLFLWLRDHTHKTTVFGFSGTFMSFAILGEVPSERIAKDNIAELITRYSHRKKIKV